MAVAACNLKSRSKVISLSLHDTIQVITIPSGLRWAIIVIAAGMIIVNNEQHPLTDVGITADDARLEQVCSYRVIGRNSVTSSYPIASVFKIISIC